MMYLAFLVCEALQHFRGRGELVRVPGEISLSISVFNIEPDEVIGDVVLVKASIHRLDILLVVVVPATLVVAQSRQRWEGLGP